jgi:hypothetical protein
MSPIISDREASRGTKISALVDGGRPRELHLITA